MTIWEEELILSSLAPKLLEDASASVVKLYTQIQYLLKIV